jgi:3-phosphoshikimate 1-carboxyvinyltransferase
MGADITLDNVKDLGGEPTADIIVRHSELHGVEIGGSIIPTLIDEIPMIAVLACFAKGQTVIRDASELKVKESNRIDVMVDNLSRMGADITATADGMIINGGKPLHGAVIDSKSDHRIAMSFTIASLLAEGDTRIQNSECVSISYPDFYNDINKLIG